MVLDFPEEPKGTVDPNLPAYCDICLRRSADVSARGKNMCNSCRREIIKEEAE